MLAKALDIDIKDLLAFDDLKDENYMKDELLKIIQTADSDYIKLLYKIHKSIVN